MPLNIYGVEERISYEWVRVLVRECGISHAHSDFLAGEIFENSKSHCGKSTSLTGVHSNTPLVILIPVCMTYTYAAFSYLSLAIFSRAFGRFGTMSRG